MSFLEMRGVSKGYAVGDGRREVLKNLDLTVERGEFVAVVGFSGAGKTTLISLLAGLAQPDAGTVWMDSQPVRGPGPDRGVVFQNYALLPWLSVQDNVALAVDAVFPDWSREKRRAQVARHVEMVGLGPARGKRPGQLSGGMRQRVALARTLAMDPKVLLLDEPLSALDALTRSTLQREIDRIFRESHKTVVLITNDVDEGLLLADRVVTLGAGPGAKLGPSIPVPLPRPRQARELDHDPAFQGLRARVIEELLASRPRLATVTAIESTPEPAPEPAPEPLEAEA
jgi:nitrate/nitrite transport system ATP-binding protein